MPFLLEVAMARVKFCCNSGANIHSRREEIVDTVKDWGLDEGEWELLPEKLKYELAEEWANDRLEIYYEELDN